MADDDIILPTNSSHSESQTLYVGDVDERTPPMTKIGETNKAANDEDSFVVVDASPANDDEDDDLDLDALLDDSVHDEADADLDALLIDNFDGEGESDAAWKKAEEEAAKAAAVAAQKKAEEEAAKAMAAAAAKKKAEEEAAAATAAALKIAEEEAAKAKAEAAKKKAEEEAAAATAAALKIAEEEATKANAAAETEAKKKAEEEAAKVAAEAKAKKKAEEEAAAKAAADAEAKKKADEEAAKAKAAAAAKKKSEQEAAKAKAAAETEAKKKAEEEAAKAKAAEARKKAEERAAKAKAIAAAKKKADEEAAAAAEAEARKKAEERAAKAKAAAAAKKKANEEAAKAKAAAALKKAEEKAAKAAAEAEAKKKAEEEAAAVKKAEEEAAAEAEAKKKAEEEAAAKAIEDSHALELDALLDDSDEEDNKDAEPEIFEDNDPSQETSDDKDETNAIEDAHALELDALLDDSDEEDHNNADVEVEEEKPPSRESSTTNKKNANTRQKTNSKASDGGEKAGLPGLASRMSNAIKNTSGKNISSSVSDTLTNSKNKVMTARDRMKEYSQKISNRASNQMRKNTKPNWTESWNSNELRSYMKTTAAFTQNVVEGRIMRQHTVEMREAEVEKDIAFKTRNHVGRPPMKSSLSRSYNQNFSSRATSGTVSSINRVTNTLFERRRKAKEKELEMKKCTPNTTPRDGDMGKRTPFSFLISPQKARPNIFREKEESIVFTPEAAKDRSIYHARSYGAHSVASYSSLCTVESFVNPQKAGIAGCQNKYQPLLHNIKGPCELCVFRLSDAEKEELDAKGRHLMVQFTRGGCQDCSAFPKDVGEPPVRLCTKCYNASHRRVPETHSIRRRKKRNGAYYGY